MIPLAPVGIIGLIFGGCCSNVFALETILKHEPSSGLLITFAQFVLTCLAALPSQLDFNRPFFLKKSSVPMRKWAFSATMFFAVNMLNNWAFAFNISVPAHIILRSFGSVTTMGAGWLRGKRYSPIQVISVGVLTLGVLISAWADASSKGKSMSTAGVDFRDSSFEAGLAVLLVAQLLSAYMGIYAQDIFAEHGKVWDQNLFYCHFLSLPMFMPLHDMLRRQYAHLSQSPPLTVQPSAAAVLPSGLARLISLTPRSVFMLTLNAVTQLLCISGVNLLSAKTSAVTVTIVLNIRKLVSFMISIWLFGNKLSGQMILGAVLVFGAGALYGWETSVGMKRRQARDSSKAKKEA